MKSSIGSSSFSLGWKKLDLKFWSVVEPKTTYYILQSKAWGYTFDLIPSSLCRKWKQCWQLNASFDNDITKFVWNNEVNVINLDKFFFVDLFNDGIVILQLVQLS